MITISIILINVTIRGFITVTDSEWGRWRGTLFSAQTQNYCRPESQLKAVLFMLSNSDAAQNGGGGEEEAVTEPVETRKIVIQTSYKTPTGISVFICWLVESTSCLNYILILKGESTLGIVTLFQLLTF